MPLVPGLNPAVRLEDDPAEGAISPMDVTVEQAGDEPDVPEFHVRVAQALAAPGPAVPPPAPSAPTGTLSS